jgi:hypothetical protein
MATKIRNTTSFGGEVKPSVPCRVQQVKDPYNCENGFFVGKIYAHFSPSLSCFATRCLCWLLSERIGGWIRNNEDSDGEHNISEMVAVLGTPCAIPSRNNNRAPKRNTKLHYFPLGLHATRAKPCLKVLVIIKWNRYLRIKVEVTFPASYISWRYERLFNITDY